MKFYGTIEKVESQADGTVIVTGVASSESVDDQNEIVTAAAMRDAIPDYMKYANIREMHALSAVGTALKLDVGDDNMARVSAHIVDPVAVLKVNNRVYRGFSIGGKVTARKAGDPGQSRD